MASGAKRRTLVTVAGQTSTTRSGAGGGNHECSSHDHPAPDLERGSRGARRPRRCGCGADLAVGRHEQRQRCVVVADAKRNPRSPVARVTGLRRHRVWHRSPLLSTRQAGLVSAGPAYASRVPLLEREAELAVLDECVTSAAAVDGRLVVISGEAGVGKTALVKELCARRRSMVRALWGQCDPLQTPRALGPVLDIARAAGGDLAKLADSDDRHRLFTEFLAACAQNGPPTLAVLDDMQWADAATLDFLAFAGRRVDRTRCVLIVTHRDDLRRDHPLRAVLGELATVERAAAASTGSAERERSRDACGLDALGSGGSPSTERRRSLRGDRAARGRPGRPDLRARHGARAARRS